MKFEWDDVKFQSNLDKHGIDFFLALEVFADPARTESVSEGEYDEDRWQTIALVRGVELAVVYTMRGDSPYIGKEGRAT